MIPARLLGFSEVGGKPVELLLLRPVSEGRWEALVQPGRRCRVGARVELAGGVARAAIVGEGTAGTRVVEIEGPWPVRELLERHGLPPLPPYIERHDAPKPEDRERYQTVYARDEGSVAAPTAGLHFTPELLARLAARGVAVHFLTLHVGAGDVPADAGRAGRGARMQRGGDRDSRGDRAGVNEAPRRGPSRRRGGDHDDPGARVGGRRRGRAPARRGRARPISSSSPATVSAWSTRSSPISTCRARRCSMLVAAFAGRER